MTVASSVLMERFDPGLEVLLIFHPQPARHRVNEVRSSFTTEDEITLVSVNGLKYMLAALDEGLRMYPPVPIGLPRRVFPQSGETIAGKFDPRNISSRNNYSNQSPYRCSTQTMNNLLIDYRLCESMGYLSISLEFLLARCLHTGALVRRFQVFERQ